jgi:hypothetical protein
MNAAPPRAKGEAMDPRPVRVQCGNPVCPHRSTLALEDTLTLPTIPTITLQTASPQPGLELLPDQQQAY